MKQGTEWTEPGKGAQLDDLWRAIIPAATGTQRASNHVLRLAHPTPPTKGRPFPSDWYHRTNLRLTGEPLTAEDVQRIAEAK